MGFYEDTQEISYNAIRDKGMLVTITYKSASDYSPSLGSVDISDVSKITYGVILEFSYKDSGVYSAKGSLVQMGDKRLLIAPLDTSLVELTEPTMNSTIDTPTEKFLVVQVKKVSPGGVPLLFDLVIRGSS